MKLGKEYFRERYHGVEGYKSFIVEYFSGNYNLASSMASSLLEKEEYFQLGWIGEKGKRIGNSRKDRRVSRGSKKIRKILLKGIREGTCIGKEGLKRFAREYFEGNSGEAYEKAYLLLGEDEFSRLKWDEDTAFGALEKIRHAMSARSKTKGSVQVEWGKSLPSIMMTPYESYDVHAALIQGIYDSSYVKPDGYDGFAKDYFDGDSFKAWTFARSLLDGKVFSELGWGRCKYTNVSEQLTLRLALESGRYKGRDGRVLFCSQFLSGRYRLAYFVARSLLDEDEFGLLGWQGTTDISPKVENTLLKMYEDSMRTKGNEGEGRGGSQSGSLPSTPLNSASIPSSSGIGGVLRGSFEDVERVDEDAIAEEDPLMDDSSYVASLMMTSGILAVSLNSARAAAL